MNTKWIRTLEGTNRLYAGKWHIGGFYYSGLVSKGDPKKYKVYCSLPGLKEVIGHYETEEEAKQNLEQAVTFWFKEANEP